MLASSSSTENLRGATVGGTLLSVLKRRQEEGDTREAGVEIISDERERYRPVCF